MAYVWIALGAVAGASARYFLSGYISRSISASFPYGTLLINITGSLVLGFFLIRTTERGLNLLASNALCLASVAAGAALARWW